MDKYKNKYRIPSARLQSWDYGGEGAYFMTICTHNREHFFGKIVPEQFPASENKSNQFIPSDKGILAEEYCLKMIGLPSALLQIL